MDVQASKGGRLGRVLAGGGRGEGTCIKEKEGEKGAWVLDVAGYRLALSHSNGGSDVIEAGVVTS